MAIESTQFLAGFVALSQVGFLAYFIRWRLRSKRGLIYAEANSLSDDSMKSDQVEIWIILSLVVVFSVISAGLTAITIADVPFAPFLEASDTFAVLPFLLVLLETLIKAQREKGLPRTPLITFVFCLIAFQMFSALIPLRYLTTFTDVNMVIASTTNTITFVAMISVKLWTTMKLIQGRTGISTPYLIWTLSLKSKPLNFLISFLLCIHQVMLIDASEKMALLHSLYVRLLIVASIAVKSNSSPDSGARELPADGPGGFKEMLRNAEGFLVFLAFMEKSVCAENVLFWKEVEMFKDEMFQAMTTATKNGTDLDMDFFLDRASKMVNRFLIDGRKRAINVSSRHMQSLRKRMAKIQSGVSKTSTSQATSLQVVHARGGHENSISASVKPGDSDFITTIRQETNENADVSAMIWQAAQPLYTLFDECQNEVFELMRNDVFVRYRESPQYRSFLEHVQAAERIRQQVEGTHLV